MTVVANYWTLWRYKLRATGLRHSLRVVYLDLCESALCSVAKRLSLYPFSPRSIQIECTTRCNLKCTMCEIAYWSEAGGDLSVADLKRMIDHLPNLKRVDLTGVGEALMNRSFLTMLEWLKSRCLYITLNDNFTMLTDEAARRIIELGVEQVFLSLDGASKQTYEKIRQGANFEKVIANAKRLIAMKTLMGKKLPEIKINTVVSSDNYHEIPEIVSLAHNLGIGMVQFVNVITFEKTAALNEGGLRCEVTEKLRAAQKNAKRLGVIVKAELFDKLPVRHCDFPWKRNFITYDGAVHPCCFTTQTGDRAAQNRRAFGNLIGGSFEQIWQSASYRSFRRQMRQGILPEACSHCPKYSGKTAPEPVPLAAAKAHGAAASDQTQPSPL